MPSVVASSGVGARRVKFWGPPPPGMSPRHPSSSSWVGARAGGWPRDAPPHPFKVKLGDHFSAAPEITPGWGLAPRCGTHGTPLRCRGELVGLPRQYTTISASMQLEAHRRTFQYPSKGTPRTLWPRTLTLAAVLQLIVQSPHLSPSRVVIGRSQRLKKTETPKRNHQKPTAWARPSPGGASVCNFS